MFMFRAAKLGWFLCALVLLTASGSGCSRDPNVRKHKFYEQGGRDFEKGKYPEGAISFSRALQVDPRFAEAHYKLAQCQLREGSWPSAFRELQRTIELQPENWQAQVDLGQLLLAAGKRQDAKDRAMLVL